MILDGREVDTILASFNQLSAMTFASECIRCQTKDRGFNYLISVDVDLICSSDILGILKILLSRRRSR